MNNRRGSTVLILAAVLLTTLMVAAEHSENSNPPLSTDNPASGLTVHEWGTFTSVAGADGKPIEWQPLSGPSDLPKFVTEMNPLSVKFSSLTGSAPVVRATVRMETPVLYFYSPRETSVDVKVQFHHGLVTEWYPQAKVSPPGPMDGIGLSSMTGRIEWNSVRIIPGAAPEFLVESNYSHYYAARRTDAAPVKIGSQAERFLFYRGVGSFDVPIEARVAADGKIVVKNSGGDPVPSLILFENRGGNAGYRVQSSLQSQTTLNFPEPGGNLESLLKDFEQILTRQGLYPMEAKAMIETWRDSWFEEGTRVFYIVPSRAVDAILPLSINPTPASVSRVFVGRIEVITPATVQEVESAIARNDQSVLNKYGRFLEAIQKRTKP